MKTFEIVIIMKDDTGFKYILYPVIVENIAETVKVVIKHARQVNIVDEIKSISIIEK